MAGNININLNLNKFKNLPSHFQILITVAPAIVLIALFFFLIFSPNNKKIKGLELRLAKVEKDIEESQAKISKLDVLIEENKVLKVKLQRLKEQLPEEKEVSVLLKQISELGLRSGLEILLWKPEARKTGPGGLYVEIPVRVEVLTGYHRLGDFFSHISRLPRLVNISQIKLKKHSKKGRALIKSTFLARTFASVEPGSAAGGKTVRQ
jgi:type IV pilus assembly protein PilO